MLGKQITHVINQHWGLYKIVSIRNGVVLVQGKMGIGVIPEKELTSKWKVKE